MHADSQTAVNLPTPGAGNVQARRPFANLNSFTTIRWDGWASFNALTIGASHRIAYGLSFDANYTWSHSIDDASDAGTTNAEFNLPQNIYANDLAVEEASSSFDHRNRFVGDVIYDLPFARGTAAWVRALAAGWRASGIFIAQSGSPFTVNLGPSNDAANIGLVNGNNLERPNVTGNPNTGPKTAANWFNTGAFSLPSAFTFGNDPRNSVIGPGFRQPGYLAPKRVGIARIDETAIPSGRLQYSQSSELQFAGAHCWGIEFRCDHERARSEGNAVRTEVNVLTDGAEQKRFLQGCLFRRSVT